MQNRVGTGKLSALIGVFALTLLGCDYSQQQALRTYDGDLQSIRHIIDDLARYQPRLQDKRSSSRHVEYVDKEILNRCRSVVKALHEIHPTTPRLLELHSELLDIWNGYVDSFETFVDGLEDHNLKPKKRDLQQALERQEVSLRWWNGEFQAYQDQFE